MNLLSTTTPCVRRRAAAMLLLVGVALPGGSPALGADGSGAAQPEAPATAPAEAPATPPPEPARDAAGDAGKPALPPDLAELQRLLRNQLPAPAAAAAGADHDGLGPAAAERLKLPYLRPAEATDLRIHHGVPFATDLDTPARRAAFALQRGDFASPALLDPAAPMLDRAEAAVQRGETDAALALLAGAPGARAVRLRVDALEQAGRYPEAVALARTLVDRLGAGELAAAPDITDAVRAAITLNRLAGPRAPGAGAQGEFQSLMRALGAARQADPFHWPAPLAEAELLFDKDNFEQCQAALAEAKALNPTAAEILALEGRVAIAGFALDGAEEVARALDAGVAPPPAAPAADRAGAAAAGLPDPALAPPAADRPSPHAASIRARAMVRQDAPDLGEAALAPALSLYPRRRDLLEAAVAVQALRYDDATLRARLDAYETLSPASPHAYLAAGKALADARQYAPAAALLGEARRRAPRWAQPVAELGLLEVQSGRDAEALDALESAAELDPFNIRVTNSLKLLREVAGYTRVEGEHFVIRAKPGLDVRLAREMLPVLDAMHGVVAGDGPGLRHEPAARTLIDLMPDHAWFAVRIAGLPRIHTIAASTGPVIAMETPRDGRGHSGTYDWPRVIRHEYTHTVGLSRTRNRVPHWFTEAQAVYLELAPRDERTIELLAAAYQGEKLFDFTRINIAFTRPERPTDRPLAYAQGHWMYQYIVETWGEEAPLKLMDLYAQGVREEEAFKRVLEVDRGTFTSVFLAWARDRLVEWGMLPRAGQPTLAELLEAHRAAAAAAPQEPDGAPPQSAPDEPTRELVDAWLADHPDHPDLLELAVGFALEAAGGEPTREMAPLLKRFAAARPIAHLPHRLLARLELAGPDPLAAIPHLEFLDAREEKQPVYAAQLAALHARAGDWAKAAASAERAVRLAPFQAPHRELAAGLALKQSDLPAARRHLEFLAELEPDRPIHAQRLEALGKLEAR